MPWTAVAEAVEAARVAMDERGGRVSGRTRDCRSPVQVRRRGRDRTCPLVNGGPAKPTSAHPGPPSGASEGAPRSSTTSRPWPTWPSSPDSARTGGARWGRPRSPARSCSPSGAVDRPGLQEVALGTPLAAVLAAAAAGPAAGVLVGGYFGTWLTPGEASKAVMSRRGLEPHGASPGCGLIRRSCRRGTALSRRWRTSFSGWPGICSLGQCGACINGLPARRALSNRSSTAVGEATPG